MATTFHLQDLEIETYDVDDSIHVNRLQYCIVGFIAAVRKDLLGKEDKETADAYLDSDKYVWPHAQMVVPELRYSNDRQ